MQEHEITFAGHSILNKEAAYNPKALLQILQNAGKKMNPFKGKSNDPVPEKFMVTPEDIAVDKSKMKLYNTDEVAEKLKDETIREGTGGFVVDGALGLTKMVAPGTKNPIENGVFKYKNTLDQWDTKAGQVLAGDNPDSLRGKLFSKKVAPKVGEVEGGDSLLRQSRKPSAFAPVENTLKVTSPFLAAAYVGEKLYPDEIRQDVNQAPYEPNVQKTASHDYFDSSIMEQMDKIASLQKIAELELSVSKFASELETLSLEKTAVERQLEVVTGEKEEMEKRAAVAERNYLEKQSEYDELRLRTIAQKRSKVAVELGEEMLEVGLVKQAELDSMIDRLMDCDESTIKMYKNMVNDTKKQDESIETLAFLREYKSNDKLATTSFDLAPNSLSKRGQSIGEAARDLNKK